MPIVSKQDGDATWDFPMLRMIVFSFLLLLPIPVSGFQLVEGDELQSGRKDDRPNVLFLFADDFAYDCVRETGNDRIETPNLDELASSGTVFSHAYNMGAWNGAVCLASRAMLNTGQTVWRAHLPRRELKERFADRNLMWSQRFSRAGYKTYMTGKWHVSYDPTRIFDVTKDIRPGMPNQTKAGYHRPKSPEDQSWSPFDEKFNGYWKGGKHWSEVVADNTIEFIDDAATGEQPFFMYVAFNAPHDPRQSPREYVEKYPPDTIKLPQPFLGEYPFDLPMKKIRDEVLAPFPRTPYSVRVNRAEYYAIITHLDAQIGRILRRLREKGLERNTRIVFTADHGLAVGHHGLMGKQNLFDHSMRVPFFVKGPGIAKEKTIESRIYLQDVVPTTLDWAGAKAGGIEFKSLVPLMAGKTEHYPSIYGGYTQSQRCLIKGKYKLIVYPKLNRRLLFDLENDPFETVDLSSDPKLKNVINELQESLKAEQLRLDDPLVASQE